MSCHHSILEEKRMYLWWSLTTLYLQSVPGESYRTWLRSLLLYVFYVFWALSNSNNVQTIQVDMAKTCGEDVPSYAIVTKGSEKFRSLTRQHSRRSPSEDLQLQWPEKLLPESMTHLWLTSNWLSASHNQVFFTRKCQWDGSQNVWLTPKSTWDSASLMTVHSNLKICGCRLSMVSPLCTCNKATVKEMETLWLTSPKKASVGPVGRESNAVRVFVWFLVFCCRCCCFGGEMALKYC